MIELAAARGCVIEVVKRGRHDLLERHGAVGCGLGNRREKAADPREHGRRERALLTRQLTVVVRQIGIGGARVVALAEPAEC